MEKKMNNKGFSLVELIIVIAIMAVLIGILAPQYLKYVQRSKVSSDITNAEEIATAVNVAIADGQLTPGSTAVTLDATNIGTAGIENLTSFPTSKVNSSYVWSVTYNNDGVSTITLGASGSSIQIYPDASAYHTQND